MDGDQVEEEVAGQGEGEGQEGEEKGAGDAGTSKYDVCYADQMEVWLTRETRSMRVIPK